MLFKNIFLELNVTAIFIVGKDYAAIFVLLYEHLVRINCNFVFIPFYLKERWLSLRRKWVFSLC
jgi:hypothetical protein